MVISIERRIACSWVCALSLLPCGAARAGGPVHGARAAGMGTAFTAVSNDPSAMAFNPAGLTQLVGTQVYGGIAPVIPTTTFRSPAGQELSTTFQVFPAPQLYATSDLGLADLRVGLAVFSPFGIGGRSWPPDGLTRYLSVESTIATLTVNPAVAYRLFGIVSVAGGVDYMLARSTATRRLDQSALGAPDGDLDQEASGSGWGYNLGLLVVPFPELSIGFAYRSGVEVTQTGTVKLSGIAPPLQPAFGGQQFQTNVRMPVRFPSVLTAGLAWRPGPALTIAADLEHVRWSSFQNAILELGRQVPEAGFGSVSVPLNWRDSWQPKVGAEWRIGQRFALRTGYAYIQTPVPDATLDPSNPDSNGHNLMVGAGYDAGTWVLDAFYGVEIYETRTVSNAILSGTYTNFAQYAGVSFGWRWRSTPRTSG